MRIKIAVAERAIERTAQSDDLLSNAKYSFFKRIAKTDTVLIQ